MQNKPKWYQNYLPWMVMGIFFINTLIKGWEIAEEGLYLDEAIQIFEGQRSFSEVLKWSAQDPTPPLYYLLSSGWNKIFGISELSARALSLLFSSFTAVILFLIGRKHFNLTTGIFAAAWFSVSEIQLAYAQEARAYALFCLLASISLYVLFDYLKQNSKKSFWLFYVSIRTVPACFLCSRKALSDFF